MNRRKAITTLAASPLLAAAAAAVRPQYYELRKFELRNGTQPQRTNDFLAQHFMPAAKRAGLGPIGVFSSINFGSESSPFLLLLLTYSSFADVENTWSRIISDSALASALGQWHKPMDPGYARSENMVLRAFAGHPQLRIPPATREGHIFELRTYESNNEQTLRRKIDMFNGGETQIFQRVGLQPVFFGETIVGSRMPNLTYMLSYKDLATRESVWKAFEADPEWKKLRARPGLSDAEIVADISSAVLGPTPYSDIR
jgi:hypothetical protein